MQAHIDEGSPGFGVGAGHYETVPTGRTYRGQTTCLVGCAVCCFTGCPCGFCIPLDNEKKRVWVPAGGSPPMQAYMSGPPVVQASVVGQSPEIVKVNCGGTCGQIVQVQPTGVGLIEFTCPFCGAVNHIEYSGQPHMEVTMPPWWLAKPSMGESELMPVDSKVITTVQTMLDETWKSVTTRDRGYTKPQKFQVVQVNQNCNPKLWSNYVNAREQIRSKMDRCSRVYDDIKTSPYLDNSFGTIEEAVNECMLFHGTKPEAVENICKSDFMINLAGSAAGSLYGKGIYFGENSTKSDEYATDSNSGIYKGLYAMLLCRVTLGRVLYDSSVNVNAADLQNKCTSGQFDSILGDREKCRGTYREFIVFKNDVAYPELAIVYRRVDAD
eukprot:TRINITY_DN28801_c0_g1_i1.p1 TRINITY_DN28801_c0_g1~~TRINITY_DN28801_c0_g1_i1.p1  ORF type:complete len:383 (-),score=49.90 TRINITY_DN28801_c0_g1_i1:59-1207(-)